MGKIYNNDRFGSRFSILLEDIIIIYYYYIMGKLSFSFMFFNYRREEDRVCMVKIPEFRDAYKKETSYTKPQDSIKEYS